MADGRDLRQELPEDVDAGTAKNPSSRSAAAACDGAFLEPGHRRPGNHPSRTRIGRRDSRLPRAAGRRLVSTASATSTCMKCGGRMRPYERSSLVVEQCEDCRAMFLDAGRARAVDRRRGWRLVRARRRALVCPGHRRRATRGSTGRSQPQNRESRALLVAGRFRPAGTVASRTAGRHGQGPMTVPLPRESPGSTRVPPWTVPADQVAEGLGTDMVGGPVPGGSGGPPGRVGRNELVERRKSRPGDSSSSSSRTR